MGRNSVGILVTLVLLAGCQGTRAPEKKPSLESESAPDAAVERIAIFDVGFQDDKFLVATSAGLLELRLASYREDGRLEPASVINPVNGVAQYRLSQGGEGLVALGNVNNSSSVNSYLIDNGRITAVDLKEDYIDMQFTADGSKLVTSAYTEFSVYDREADQRIDHRLFKSVNMFECYSALVPGSFGQILAIEHDEKTTLWNPIRNKKIEIDVGDEVYGCLFAYQGAVWSDCEFPPKQIAEILGIDLPVEGDGRFEVQGPWRYSRSADKMSAEFYNMETKEKVDMKFNKTLSQANRVLPLGVYVQIEDDHVLLQEVGGARWMRIYPQWGGLIDSFCIITSDSQFSGFNAKKHIASIDGKALVENNEGVRLFYKDFLRY